MKINLLESVYSLKTKLTDNPDNIELYINNKKLCNNQLLLDIANNKIDIREVKKGGNALLDPGNYKFIVIALSFLTPYLSINRINNNLTYALFFSDNQDLKLPNPKFDKNMAKPFMDYSIKTFSAFDSKNKDIIAYNSPNYYGVSIRDDSLIGHLFKNVSLIYYFICYSLAAIAWFSSYICYKPKSFTPSLIFLLLSFLPVIFIALGLFLKKLFIGPTFLGYFFTRFRILFATILIIIASIVIPIIFKQYLTSYFLIGLGCVIGICFIVLILSKTGVLGFSRFETLNIPDFISKTLRFIFRPIFFASPSEIVGNEDYFIMYTLIYKIILSLIYFAGFYFGFDYSLIPGVKKMCKGTGKTTLTNNEKTGFIVSFIGIFVVLFLVNMFVKFILKKVI